MTDLLSLLEGFITVNAHSVLCNILQSALADVDSSEKSEDVAIMKHGSDSGHARLYDHLSY